MSNSHRVTRALCVCGVMLVLSATASAATLARKPPRPSPTPTATSPAPTPTPTVASPTPAPSSSTPAGRPASIPVLAYHQLDNGCAPAATICNAADYESLSQAQFANELSYLRASGYTSVTAAQYVAWAARKTVVLPAKPILITVDDGIENFFSGGTAILRQYGFRAVAFIVTQFADGATVTGSSFIGWDASWSELSSLDPEVWEFAFHAGAQGHSIAYPDNPGCAYFYPCQLPAESAAAYETRVSAEIGAGRLELDSRLWSRAVNDDMWAVPWNDLAQPGSQQPVSGADPPDWLPLWASYLFPVVFVQDAGRNGMLNEHYRLELHGDMTESSFETQLRADISAGNFDG